MIGDDDRIATTVLLERLCRLEEAPWSDWYGRPINPRDLAKWLKPYGISSRDVRYGPDPSEKAKGYRREDFEDAWTRYLPPVRPCTQGDIRDKSDNSTPATPHLSPLSLLSPTPGSTNSNGHAANNTGHGTDDARRDPDPTNPIVESTRTSPTVQRDTQRAGVRTRFGRTRKPRS